ncbi:MAG: MFS transporter [Thermoplasmataceae archaeon]
MRFSEILKNRNIRLLWLGSRISLSGNVIFTIALNWTIFIISHSLILVSIALAFAIIPYVVIGPLAGNILDRHNKVRITTLALCFQGLIVVLFAIMYTFGMFFIPVILIGLFILNAVGQVPANAVDVLIPRFISKENLGSTNSLFSIGTNITQVTGFGLGGIIITLFGAGLPIIYDATTFFLGALLIGLINFEDDATIYARSSIKFTEQFQIGLKWMSRNKLIIELLFVNLISLAFSGILEPLFVAYSSNISGGEAYAYGAILTSTTVGSLISSFVIGKVNIRNNSGIIVIISLSVLGIFMILLGLFAVLLLAIVFTFFIGFSYSLIIIPTSSIIQAVSGSDKLGLINSTFFSLIIVAPIISEITAGYLANFISVRILIAIPGLILLMISVLLFPSLKTLREAKF